MAIIILALLIYNVSQYHHQNQLFGFHEPNIQQNKYIKYSKLNNINILWTTVHCFCKNFIHIVNKYKQFSLGGVAGFS